MKSLLLVTSTLAAASAFPKTVGDANDIIRDHVNSYTSDVEIGKTLCEKYTCCTVTATNSCELSTMPRDQTTLVLPGGESRCIYSYSTPFAFQVIPGDKDKVLMYFQGNNS